MSLTCNKCSKPFSTKDFMRHIVSGCFKAEFNHYLSPLKKKIHRHIDYGFQLKKAKEMFLLSPDSYASSPKGWAFFMNKRKKQVPFEKWPLCAKQDKQEKALEKQKEAHNQQVNDYSDMTIDSTNEENDVIMKETTPSNSNANTNKKEGSSYFSLLQNLEENDENDEEYLDEIGSDNDEDEMEQLEEEEFEKNFEKNKKPAILEFIECNFVEKEISHGNDSVNPVYSLLKDKELLKVCSKEEESAFRIVAIALHRFIAKKREELGKLTKISTSPEEIMREIPGPLLFLVKYASITDYFRSTHVKPVVQELNSKKCNFEIIKKHEKSMNKKLNQIILLSDCFCNVGNQLRPSSLKLIITSVLRKKNVPKEILQAFSNLGCTLSSQNYARLMKNHPALQNLDQELWEKQRNDITNGTSLWISDNKHYPIEKHNIGREETIHVTDSVTCEIITLQNPSEKLQKLRDQEKNSVFSPIPKSNFSTDFLNLTENEQKRYSSAWEDAFKAVENEKPIYSFKEQASTLPQKSQETVCESLIGKDLSEEDNYHVSVHMEKFVKKKLNLSDCDLSSIKICDQHGSSQFRKMIFQMNNPLRIQGLYFVGDWHIWVHLLKQCQTQ